MTIAEHSQLCSAEFVIGGMTCAACATRIERKLNKIPGVAATVNFATEVAAVQHTDRISVQVLVSAIEKAGFTATSTSLIRKVTSAGAERSAAGMSQAQLRWIIAAVLGLPVVLISMVPALQFPFWQWAALALATPVVVVCGWPFYRSALHELKNRSATMDTLVALGVSAAYLWSCYALIFGGAGRADLVHEFTLFPGAGHAADIYLEVAVGVTVFLLLGRWWETKAKRASGAALHALLSLAAKEVSLLTDNNGVDQETRVPVDQLIVGSRFVVRPGEKVATDGVVIAGASAIDQSLLTGESAPIEVQTGSTVFGGTINVGGRLVIRATQVGADTQLAHLMRLVTQAQTSKAAIQRLTDRVSGIFVPVVLILALGTFLAWLFVTGTLEQAFVPAVAVLVIACPCALGLATPTALLVGTGRGAQLGILIKGVAALESARKIDTIVLDKTGTVTTGRMSLIDVVPVTKFTRGEILRFAGAVESAAHHPIARAIVDVAVAEIENLPEVIDFQETPGLGASGIVQGRHIEIGRVDVLLADKPLPMELVSAQETAEKAGLTIVALTINGAVAAVLTVADVVRPTSAAAIQHFRRLGLRPVLLTGDHTAVARIVAAQVGIPDRDVIAEVFPADKVAAVQTLQHSGAKVAMVGDGVNDAPALAVADVGIAMGTGTDAAIEAGDITVLRGDLLLVATAMRLARRTVQTIYGNLFWAFAYNIAGLPLAALGMLNPMIAGMAMTLSSVFVVTNSLWLRRFKADVT